MLGIDVINLAVRLVGRRSEDDGGDMGSAA